MDKVLLTGADGLLGNNIARVLLERGYQVKALFEKGKKSSTYDELSEVECVYGDILDEVEVLELMSSCDYVIHVGLKASCKEVGLCGHSQ
ncbi:MAG: NAD-dependent epimerase/dehydratase family protein [Bacteroidetes bacterium]|nr:NAD-dependent epimerase/dehydratase family protein [Bacteroidota bacterium]